MTHDEYKHGCGCSYCETTLEQARCFCGGRAVIALYDAAGNVTAWRCEQHRPRTLRHSTRRVS